MVFSPAFSPLNELVLSGQDMVVFSSSSCPFCQRALAALKDEGAGTMDRWKIVEVPSGKQPHSYRKSPCLMGKSTISMAMASIAM